VVAEIDTEWFKVVTRSFCVDSRYDVVAEIDTEGLGEGPFQVGDQFFHRFDAD
jgi:hypothetical protein